mgnify:CR=1 FL=1
MAASSKQVGSAQVDSSTPAKRQVQPAADKEATPVHISGWVRSGSSQLASLISVTVCFPLEVIKTRMQI